MFNTNKHCWSDCRVVIDNSIIKLYSDKKAMEVLNVPNHKSSQTYYFTNPYEAKHAIGSRHSKRKEFESREGISSVESLCDYITCGLPPNYYGRFIIRGQSSAVDNLIIEIKEWLERCQDIYIHNQSNRYQRERH